MAARLYPSLSQEYRLHVDVNKYRALEQVTLNIAKYTFLLNQLVALMHLGTHTCCSTHTPKTQKRATITHLGDKNSSAKTTALFSTCYLAEVSALCQYNC